jgi:hypothetical protein
MKNMRAGIAKIIALLQYGEVNVHSIESKEKSISKEENNRRICW